MDDVLIKIKQKASVQAQCDIIRYFVVKNVVIYYCYNFNLNFELWFDVG